jgi:putative ABC transport system ATP-binding protein
MTSAGPTSGPGRGSAGQTAEPSAAVLVGRGIRRSYGEGDALVHALRGVSLDIMQGELTAVMGPSGSGKSTLMHILAGLDRPTSGSVSIDGTELTTLDETALTLLRRQRIGFIFQFFNLLPMLTAEENIVLPLKIAGQQPDAAFVDEIIRTVGLEPRRTHRPAEMSGGQQQRVAVARAFVSRPAVVFADEPTGNLDSRTSGEILELMRSSVDSYGQTTVMVTHDPTAATFADRVLFLADGQIMKDLGRSTAHQILAAMEELGG